MGRKSKRDKELEKELKGLEREVKKFVKLEYDKYGMKPPKKKKTQKKTKNKKKSPIVEIKKLHTVITNQDKRIDNLIQQNKELSEQLMIMTNTINDINKNIRMNNMSNDHFYDKKPEMISPEEAEKKEFIRREKIKKKRQEMKKIMEMIESGEATIMFSKYADEVLR